MCCFSKPVRFVGATRIFARPVEHGRQVLVYAMDVEIDAELAMVLPLPVPPSPGEDAVTFVDLSGHAAFFDDLDKAFPPDYSFAPLQAGPVKRGGPVAKNLAVHDVGDFEASFVPTPADFARLDPRFRMPESAFASHPEYADYGFAVFRLKPTTSGLFSKAGRQRVHPMAFTFPRRDTSALFFPTLHVHDGTAPERANFDHALFCQPDPLVDATLDWPVSHAPLGQFVTNPASHAVIDGARTGRRKALWGTLGNHDVILRTPEGVTLEDLSGRGETYAYTVRATYAHLFEAYDPRSAAWMKNASTRLAPLCQTLRDGLAALTAQNAEAWQLTRLTPELPPHFMNGDQLWTGTSYMNGRPVTEYGPGSVTMQIFTDRVEPQHITLGFESVPDVSRIANIRTALRALLDGAVA